MEFNNYQKLALRTINPELSPEQNLLNACLGLAGEAGEFCDLIKKKLYHSHPTDNTKLLKELGDILWYISQASHALQQICGPEMDFSLDVIAQTNITKLEARYAGAFSSEKSINRTE